MVAQYPHWLQVKALGFSVKDSHGNYVEVKESWETLGECRYQVNGTGRQLRTEDGQSVVYGGVVYAPISMSRTLGRGELLRVFLDQRLVGEGSVLRFSRDGLHCRIWL